MSNENPIITIVFNLISQLWWLILILAIIPVFKMFVPYIKGKLGEYIVQYHAKKILNEDYILLNDLTFLDQDNQTTQIDHILLSPYGIFVIETKNYKGWIFGSSHQKMWTQKIYKSSHKFQNPLHQNYKHIKVLDGLLKDLIDSNLSIHGLIVFVPNCEFKTPIPVHVHWGKSWIEEVKSYQMKVIDDRRLQRIKYRIEKAALQKSWKTNREHIRSVKERLKD